MSDEGSYHFMIGVGEETLNGGVDVDHATFLNLFCNSHVLNTTSGSYFSFSKSDGKPAYVGKITYIEHGGDSTNQAYINFDNNMLYDAKGYVIRSARFRTVGGNDNLSIYCLGLNNDDEVKFIVINGTANLYKTEYS